MWLPSLRLGGDPPPLFFLPLSISHIILWEQLQGVFVGGAENLPGFIARRAIPGTTIVVDPCAAILVLLVTALLCIGIREVHC